MYRSIALLIIAGSLVSCSQQQSDSPSNTDPLSAPVVEDGSHSDTEMALTAGRYCFSSQGETEFLDIDFEVLDDGSVRGSYNYMLSDHENEEYADSFSELRGELDGDILRLNLTTFEFGDAIETSVEWHVTDNGIMIEGTEAIACENPPSWCEADELALFSCPLQDGPVVSLCGPIDLMNTGEGYLQFRSGSMNEEPALFPASLDDSASRFEWESAMYSGGWDTQLRFIDGDQEIRLFDRAIKVSMSEKDFASGMTVSESGGDPVEMLCEAESTEFGDMLIGQLQGIVPDGDFIYD